MRKRKKAKKVKDSEEIEINLLKIIKSIKPYIPYTLLLVFLLYGSYLRFYHIGYPVIGYHNWKSAHYITEARNFAREGFFKYGFFVPMRDTINIIDEPADGQHKDTFPMISIVVGLLFKIFGESIVIAGILVQGFS